ncbi:hypothetical protein [Paenibacillus sp. GCM10027626]|uniref:hypothetical protein n=1 Tax=Paenibacillus sp. GCM10027626 TaxID=3273411 RepID=UPI00363EF02E
MIRHGDWTVAATWPLLPVSVLLFWRMIEKEKYIVLGWLVFAIPAVVQFVLASRMEDNLWLKVCGWINVALMLCAILLTWFLFKIAAAYKKK